MTSMIFMGCSLPVLTLLKKLHDLRLSDGMPLPPDFKSSFRPGRPRRRPSTWRYTRTAANRRLVRPKRLGVQSKACQNAIPCTSGSVIGPPLFFSLLNTSPLQNVHPRCCRWATVMIRGRPAALCRSSPAGTRVISRIVSAAYVSASPNAWISAPHRRIARGHGSARAWDRHASGGALARPWRK